VKIPRAAGALTWKPSIHTQLAILGGKAPSLGCGVSEDLTVLIDPFFPEVVSIFDRISLLSELPEGCEMLFLGYQAPATGCDGDLRLVGSIVQQKRIANECARLMWENISGGHFVSAQIRQESIVCNI
jgi:hypothetical protein